MRYITSKENKIYKEAKRLLTHSHRVKNNLFLAEGVRIVTDAIKSNAAKYVILSESYAGMQPEISTFFFSDRLFSEISDTQNSQGIIAVCGIEKKAFNNIDGNLLLICDGISDPGNLGTMIRTAESAGVSGVVLLKGCVDVYNPKTVRSTMGSVFRVPLYNIETHELSKLTEYDIIAAQPQNAQSLYDTSFNEKTALVIGSEAHGISAEAQQFVKRHIKIPMGGKATSLNAGIAAGIILYEIYRQTAAEGKTL